MRQRHQPVARAPDHQRRDSSRGSAARAALASYGNCQASRAAATRAWSAASRRSAARRPAAIPAAQVHSTDRRTAAAAAWRRRARTRLRPARLRPAGRRRRRDQAGQALGVAHGELGRQPAAQARSRAATGARDASAPNRSSSQNTTSCGPSMPASVVESSKPGRLGAITWWRSASAAWPGVQRLPRVSCSQSSGGRRLREHAGRRGRRFAARLGAHARRRALALGHRHVGVHVAQAGMTSRGEQLHALARQCGRRVANREVGDQRPSPCGAAISFRRSRTVAGLPTTT